MRIRRGLLGLCLALGCDAPPTTPKHPGATVNTPYMQRRAAHETKLDRDAPTGARYPGDAPPEGVERVAYKSGQLELWGWFAKPADGKGPFPAVVYLHGGFAFARSDFEKARLFVEAGFVLMTPTLRGENGNPGRHELLYGELDDAVAATAWLAKQPGVDPARIYAVGHSAGGGLAALLALRPDAPLRATASAGGIYVPETFQRWSNMPGNKDLVRFDPYNRNESRMRTLVTNMRDMVRPHIAYIGRSDTPFHPNGERAAREARELDAPFELVMVDGDHDSALEPALAAFAEHIQESP